IYLLNGCWLPEVNDNFGRALRGKLANALYRNNGDGTFTEVTAQAGVGDQRYGMGVSAADYDNDGDLDLYVLNYGPNVLYRNNGNGTFTNVASEAGLDDRNWSVSAPWLDYDGDGDLDVYVANYLEYDAGKFRDFYAAAGYPGPLSYQAQPDRLYRNNGDGTFTNVTSRTGLHFPDGRAMSAVATDLNDDGLPDIYVANDATPNCYFVNSGRGSFEDRALLMGLAFGEGGQGASSMGPVIGDVDRNGLLDVYVPDMGYGCLLVNKGKMFVDVTAPSNLAVVCGQYTGWGGGLIDYDNDGHLDVFVANGNAHHEYTEEDVLLRNDGNGRFIDVAEQSGPYFREKHVGRGAAFADYDNDGDIDILVMNLNGPAKLLRNDGGNRNNWLKIVPQLAGTKVEAIGARVTVVVGKMRMVQEVAAVTGYLSQSDARAHFGLGSATKVDRVEIRWPGGQITKLENVKANQILEVRQAIK
ncbi:MAG: CRTAC1 family protein, partial [Dehalococcoidia bacterium]